MQLPKTGRSLREQILGPGEFKYCATMLPFYRLRLKLVPLYSADIQAQLHIECAYKALVAHANLKHAFRCWVNYPLTALRLGSDEPVDGLTTGHAI